MTTVLKYPTAFVTSQGDVRVDTAPDFVQGLQPGNYTIAILNGGMLQMSFGTISTSFPAGAVLLSAVLSTQCYAGYATNYIEFYRNVSNARPRYGPVGVTVWTTYTGNTATDNAGVAPTLFTQLDNFVVTITIPLVVANNHIVFDRVSLDVQYATVPTVYSVLAAAGTDASSRVVSWSFQNGSEVTGGQTKYQMRVFNQAQYSIVGFDPATSPASQDTGVVVSGFLTRSISGLNKSGGYRVYVRGAQTTRGVDMWSGYSYVQITVQLKMLNYWNGSAFVLCPVKIWNSTTFTDATNIRVWNGSAWVTAVNG